MDASAITAFISRVLTAAERAFGPRADRRLLEQFAREAVLDLWLAGPLTTVSSANHALLRLRDAIAQPGKERHVTDAGG